MKKHCFFGLLSFALLGQPAWLGAQDGKLAKVREEVRVKHEAEPAADKPSTDDDDDLLGGILGDSLGEGFMACCWLLGEGLFGLPRRAIADEDDADAFFLNYPHRHGQAGPLWLRHTRDEDKPGKVRNWSARLAIEESNDFRGINRINGDLIVDTSSRFGLQASWSYLTERLDDGRHDELFLGAASITYRFAQSERVQCRAGLGFRCLTDRCGSDFGCNVLYGADFFPVKPLVVTTLAELGSLGSAFVVHARATAGAVFRHTELFTGYDFLRIGSVNLQGPVLGLRFWF